MEPKARDAQICIVGGGPAGMVLGYLLGRCGVQTLVLESQDDFDRDFRGDTIHAGVMEIFDSIRLSESILKLPHHKIPGIALGGVTFADFNWLDTEFPFVTMMAQSVFLNFLSNEAARFDAFEIEMGAKARDLVRDENSGQITGVTYRQNGEMITVNAELVVACDGRGSRMRKEAKLVPEPMTDPLEVLWFRLPKEDTDGEKFRSGALVGGRLPLFLLERKEHYQIAVIIPVGHFSEIRKAGLSAFHARIQQAAPELFDRAVENLDDWKKIAFLHVEGSRLKSWHTSGMLLIGDAAHVMTPVGGVGINYAIWDAVETANVLVPVLKSGGKISEEHLVEIQNRRIDATKKVQRVQRVVGKQVLKITSSDRNRNFALQFVGLVTKLPFIRTAIPRLIALGGERTRCEVAEHFVDRN